MKDLDDQVQTARCGCSGDSGSRGVGWKKLVDAKRAVGCVAACKRLREVRA